MSAREYYAMKRESTMRILTVQQPWGWCIIHGGKTPENRTQEWGYRGPVAIHAGRRWSDRGAASPLVRRAVRDHFGTEDPISNHHLWPAEWHLGHVIGIVQLVDVHPEEGGCCPPWGETSYVAHGGRLVRDIVHLVLERPRVFVDPIRARGQLGLWKPDRDLEQLIDLQILASKPGAS